MLATIPMTTTPIPPAIQRVSRFSRFARSASILPSRRARSRLRRQMLVSTFELVDVRLNIHKALFLCHHRFVQPFCNRFYSLCYQSSIGVGATMITELNCDFWF